MSNTRHSAFALTLVAALASGGPKNHAESAGSHVAGKPGCVLDLRDASRASVKNGVVEGGISGGVLRTSYDPGMWIEVKMAGEVVRMPGILGSDALYEDCIPAANEAGVLDLVVETGDPKVHQKLIEDLRAEGLNNAVIVRVLPTASTNPVEDAPEKEG
jgi:hypothetical protein